MPDLATRGLAILVAPAFGALFAWLCVGLGWYGLRWLRLAGEASLLERLVIAGALGAGLLQFVPFGLAAFGWLSVASLRVATLLLALALLPVLFGVFREFRAWLREKPKLEPWVGGWLLVLSPAVLVAGLFATGPTLDADGLSYHLTLPKRWFEAGSLAYVATYPHGNAPMGAEMLFMFGLVFGGDASAKIVHLCMGSWAALGLWLAGARIRPGFLGPLAATLYLVGPAGVIALMGWAYLEGITSFAIVAATLCWVIWFQEGNQRWLAGSFLLAGMAVAFKLTSALFPAGLTVLSAVALFSRARPPERLKQTLLPFARQLLPLAALPVLPWFVRSFQLTGNPVFPLFAGTIPSRDFSRTVAALLAENQRYFIWGTGAAARLTLQDRQLFLAGLAIGAIALATFSVVRLRSPIARGITLATLFITLAQLSAIGIYQRYWLPLFAVVQLPVLALFSEFLAKHGRNLVLGVGLLGSLWQCKKMLQPIGFDAKGLVASVLGEQQRREFLLSQLPLFPLYEHANRSLPREAKILLASSCSGFYFDRTTYCGEFFQDSLRMTTWEEFADDAERLGITHIAAPRKWADGGPGPAVNFRDNEDKLVGRLIGAPTARLLSSASDQGLYEIDRKLLAER